MKIFKSITYGVNKDWQVDMKDLQKVMEQIEEDEDNIFVSLEDIDTIIIAMEKIGYIKLWMKLSEDL